MLKKLFTIALCQFATSAWALTSEVLPIDPLDPTLQGKCKVLYGINDGAACQLSMTTATACQTQTCKAYSCTNSCICAPNATYCSTLDSGVSSCPDTFCPTTPSDWTSPTLNSPYQERTTYTLNALTCKCTTKTEYRCSAGYYDANTTSFGTNAADCTKCPDPTDAVSEKLFTGASSQPEQKGITSCYIPKATGSLLQDITLTDDSGTYSFIDDCYYGD